MSKTHTLLSLFFFGTTALASSDLCHRGAGNQTSFSESITSRQSSPFVLVNWNTHKLADQNFMPDLIEIAESADVITLQEAMHSDQYQKLFSKSLDFDFSFHKSFCNNQNDATGVMNMARSNLSQNLTLVSPDTEPIFNTPKVSGYSLLRVDGLGDIHLINTHALNFNLGGKFERQINHIANFISLKQGPVIWVGDFNTWNNSRMRHLLEVTRKLGLTHHRLQNDQRNLKLDHVFSRGLQVLSAELLNQYRSSDHKPIRLVIEK